MRKKELFIVLIVSSLLVGSVFAQPVATGVLGVWRDINPTAYINPPANPPLDSVYMLNATEGWAVGDERYTTNPTYSFPAMLHYDGSTWNLVPVPKNPTEESSPDIVSGYALTSVNFGTPGNPISRNDGWAVGCGFDNGAPPPPPKCLPASSGHSDIFAIALHWDGITWREQSSGLNPTNLNTGPLQSVFMVSPTDVWAVGSNTAGTAGTFWHWTGVPGLGGGWSLQGTATAPLFSVFMVSPTEGWAVGASAVIYHYFGGTWTAVPSPLPTTTCPSCATLRSVFMVSPTEGWAVGDDGSVTPFPPGAGVGVIIHYSAGTWTGPVSPGTAPSTLRSVFLTSSTEGWAVGDAGTIVHYSGGTWTKLPVNLVPSLPEIDFNFNSVFLNAANDAWSVGSAGVIMHYDGVNWGTVTSPSLTELTSISFGPPLSGLANPNDGWAVGRATPSLLPQPPNPTQNPVAEPTIIHWNGFMWTKGVAIGTTNDLLSVFMLSTGDVWAVGGGGGGSPPGGGTTATCSTTPCPVILHFTGGSWNTITPPPGSYVLNSVFMVSASEGWAVGCSGTVAQCSPVAHSARVAGGSGIILHYTVTGGVGTWAIFPAPTTPTPLPPLNSVYMLGPNEGWAVGDGSVALPATVLHYTVTGGVGTWNVVGVNGLPTAPPLANLNSVFMLSTTSGWAVGGIPGGGSPGGPVILYWDGTHWTRVSTPTIPGGPIATPPTLNSVYCTGPTDCWTVGNFVDAQLVATIFHWDGIGWTHITLAPSLLGFGNNPPWLNSVYMIAPNDGWIVGSSPILIPPPTITGPPPASLSTILRFAPFGGVLTATSTSTIVSTVSTNSTVTNFITSSITSSFISSTTSTVGPPLVPSETLLPIILGIGVAVAVILVAVILLLGRRPRGSRPAVMYPVPRRP
jgi:hypothetical protein